MNNILALLAGASFSAAFVFPKPWCFIALTIATFSVIVMRLR